MNLSSAWLILLGIPLVQASDNRGITMTIERGGTLVTEQTVYSQADRKRMEFRNATGRELADGSTQPNFGPFLVSIVRCDLGQAYELNLDTREYTAHPYPPQPLTKEQMEARGMSSPATYLSEQPTLRIEVTTKDTGERKQIFGHAARHVITTRKQIPLEGSVSKPQEMVTDGWYIDSNSNGIDFSQRLTCDRKWPAGKRGHSYLGAVRGNQPRERVEFVDLGEPETGFPLLSTMTSKITHPLPDGTEKQLDTKYVANVTEMKEGPLDAALFEIPPGFKQVDHIERNPPALTSAGSFKLYWQRILDRMAALFR